MIGSTVQLSDGSGGPAIPKFNQAYSAFGEKIDDRFGDGESMSTRYQYAGGWGYESGLIVLEGAEGSRPIELLHVGARWYDPAIGRFVQRDPIGIFGGVNVYAYCTNDPVRLTDSTGLLNDGALDRYFERRDQMSPGDRRDLDNASGAVALAALAIWGSVLAGSAVIGAGAGATASAGGVANYMTLIGTRVIAQPLIRGGLTGSLPIVIGRNGQVYLASFHAKATEMAGGIGCIQWSGWAVVDRLGRVVQFHDMMPVK